MITVLGGFLLGLAGLVVVVAGLVASRSSNATLAYLVEAEMSGVHPATEPDTAPDAVDPLFDRVIRPVATGLTKRMRSLYPSSRLDRIHEQLLNAGLSTSLRAEEFATVQTLVAVIGVVTGVAFLIAGHGSAVLRFAVFLLLLAVCLMGPRAWLSRHVDGRTKSISRDLPDMLDLLTISVEAGLGLEGAMESVCNDLDSPIGEEMRRTIQEMSLGLSRHQALENLKTRVLAPDMRTFILVLSQADLLGMPIGRVLRTQADEMRDRRRARAREQAAKLPVKILFPLMGFILPPLMILVLGPAVSGIIGAFSRTHL